MTKEPGSVVVVTGGASGIVAACSGILAAAGWNVVLADIADEAGQRIAAHRNVAAIVNIASVAGSRSMPLLSYSPAKAAVISMTSCLAAEWGGRGVRVNSVSPGYTATPALQVEIDAGRRDVSRLAGNAALGRPVETTEIAEAVAFLLSPAASAITGIDLPVDCGWLSGSTWNTYGGLPHIREG